MVDGDWIMAMHRGTGFSIKVFLVYLEKMSVIF